MAGASRPSCHPSTFIESCALIAPSLRDGDMRRLRSLVIAALTWVSVSGCSASYSRQDTGGADLIGAHLDATKSVLIAIPDDGSYQSTPYPGSGRTVAQQTAAVFAKHTRKVDTASPGVTEKSALLDAAKNNGFGYLVIPTIAHWEHRATAWSGLPSRASIEISVFDAQTGDKLQSSIIDSRSRIVSWTSTSPESLLKGMLDNYVYSLYGGKQ